MNFIEKFAIKPVKSTMSDGTEIHIKELSYKGAVSVACEYSAAEKAILTMIHGLCDETGKNVFTEEQRDWIKENLPVPVIQEIAGKVADLSKRDMLKK
ncbi:hypothetical protein HLBENOHH_02475 [Aeromonas dhakensis]|uniref:hypothetical protein n=1 Tax=Aeromonas dhakensis TaxID=196024 RepID=UPI00366D6A8E